MCNSSFSLDNQNYSNLSQSKAYNATFDENKFKDAIKVISE